MAAPPLVSVIIPTFNRAATLGRAVNSVLNQDYAPMELIVVDDGSEDETPSILAPLREAGRLTLTRQPNLGVSAARNAGLRLAHGPLIAFLDSDDEWRPGKITAQADYFQAHPGEVLVQTQEIWMRNGRRVNPGRRHLKKDGDIFLDSLALCLISPSAVMLRRTLLDEVGWFDENLLAAEDYDLWLRVLARHQAGLIDQALVIRHGGRPDQLSANHSLDRFRIMALEKILKSPLSAERRAAATRELERRRAIYQAGRAKRER
ncbi:MAG: glycosyltransferase family 2 protein [Candidatus Adiutrix sp.]|jgi:glycosyltransferase involved in cell wall biosynthesis|nr:glycosyltransferase family 2 protein [Candidatus Adiutrix sp.]